MAKKTNKKPGQKNTAAMMKKEDKNLNHKRSTKIIIYLMILAFIGVPVAGLLVYFF